MWDRSGCCKSIGHHRKYPLDPLSAGPQSIASECHYRCHAQALVSAVQLGRRVRISSVCDCESSFSSVHFCPDNEERPRVLLDQRPPSASVSLASSPIV